MQASQISCGDCLPSSFGREHFMSLSDPLANQNNSAQIYVWQLKCEKQMQQMPLEVHKVEATEIA